MDILTNRYIKTNRCKDKKAICRYLRQIDIEDIRSNRVRVWYCSSELELCCGCCRTMEPITDHSFKIPDCKLCEEDNKDVV